MLATYLITCLGLGELSAEQWFTLFGMSLFGVCLFFLMFHTNVNLKFSEPSLTREQIVYAAVYCIMVMHWLPEARMIILLFFLPPFSFGMLSLTLRQYLNVVVLLLGLYGGLLIFEYFKNPGMFKVQYQLFLFFFFGLILVWFAFFGGFVSNLRRRLSIEKEKTKKANEELIIEVEERKELEKKILKMASTDYLTGVSNRRSFMEQARIEWARSMRYQHSLAVLMIDIDHFKRVNDTYGHHIGDVSLKTLATTCLRILRKNDVFGRLGGEEFAVILVEIADEEALLVAERLRSGIASTTITENDISINLQVSIGLALAQRSDLKIENLIERADKALYKAKRLGRNRVVSSLTKE
jgi:diguanylate cyclase (GGDEF)-like protein